MTNKRMVAAGLGVAITVSAAMSVLVAQSPEMRTRRGFIALDGRVSQLGAVLRDLDADALAGTKGAGGAQIDDVTAGGAAQKAGLKPGDIVVDYDGERVRSARQLTRLVRETAEGRKVSIGVLRAGQRQTVQATLDAGAPAWDVLIDDNRIRREVERGMRDMGRLHEFDIEPPPFDFHFEDGARWAVPRRRLGVTVDALSPQLAEYFGVKGGGALVSSVSPDSPAAKAGITAGDVITSVNGTHVEGAGDIGRAIAAAKGTDVSIGLIRNRKDMTVKASIERPERPEGHTAPRRPVG